MWWAWWLEHKGQEGGDDRGGAGRETKRRLLRGKCMVWGIRLGQAGSGKEVPGVILVQGHGNLV